MVNNQYSMLLNSIYETITVLTTVMVIAGIQQVGGAGHRQGSTTRHIPPPTGEIVANKSWAYELLDPCYQPQYNPHHHSHHQTDSSLHNQHSATQNVHTQAYVSQEGARFMTTKRRKRSINETEESILSSIQQPLGADNPTQSDSEHLSSSQNSQHSGDASQQGVMGPTYEDYHAAQLSIIHSVLRVGGFLESFLELDMGGEECVGLDLQTLADYPPVIQQNFVLTTLQLYGYLTTVRAHLLVMLSDWEDTRMLSCGTINRKLSIIGGLRRFEMELHALLCSLRIDLMRIGVAAQDLHMIVQPVLDTVIYRYPSCLSKKMRDCLVVNKLEQAFSIAIHSMTRG